MADCKWANKCEFINNSQGYGHEVIRSFFMNEYCREKHSECARFMVYDLLGEENVPCDLLPNQPGRAIGIIKSS